MSRYQVQSTERVTDIFEASAMDRKASLASTCSSLFEEGKVFVGGLSWQTTEGSFKEYFYGLGENVIDCCLMLNTLTGKPRGFGFVTFESNEAVERVMAMQHFIDDKFVEIKLCTPKLYNKVTRNIEEETNRKKVFLGGLPETIGEAVIYEIFEKAFGMVEDVSIMYEPANNAVDKPRPRGFGFVTFNSELSALQAVCCHYFRIGDKIIEIKKAEPKSLVYQYMAKSRSQHPAIEYSPPPVRPQAPIIGYDTGASMCEWNSPGIPAVGYQIQAMVQQGLISPEFQLWLWNRENNKNNYQYIPQITYSPPPQMRR